jgi:hypothetical protein
VTVVDGRSHGTSYRYQVGKCRCADCVTAEQARRRRYRIARHLRAALDPASIPHGLDGYNNGGCRCSVCSTAEQARRRAKVARARRR